LYFEGGKLQADFKGGKLKSKCRRRQPPILQFLALGVVLAIPGECGLLRFGAAIPLDDAAKKPRRRRPAGLSRDHSGSVDRDRPSRRPHRSRLSVLGSLMNHG
jgi:hypothetical protein